MQDHESCSYLNIHLVGNTTAALGVEILEVLCSVAKLIMYHSQLLAHKYTNVVSESVICYGTRHPYVS